MHGDVVSLDAALCSAISSEEAFLLYHTISSSGPPTGVGSMPWRWGGGSRMAGEEDGLSQPDGLGAGMGSGDQGGDAGQGTHAMECSKECSWSAVPALVVGGVKYHVIFADGASSFSNLCLVLHRKTGGAPKRFGGLPPRCSAHERSAAEM